MSKDEMVIGGLGHSAVGSPRAMWVGAPRSVRKVMSNGPSRNNRCGHKAAAPVKVKPAKAGR